MSCIWPEPISRAVHRRIQRDMIVEHLQRWGCSRVGSPHADLYDRYLETALTSDAPGPWPAGHRKLLKSSASVITVS